jgi:hypothetical protein
MNAKKTETLRGGLMPLWMLNDASTPQEKVDYMRRCRAGGIRSLTLHPRAGNLIPFASREWFAMVKTLVEAAARIDMKLWLYDEDPYPSGAAGGLVMAERPDLKARCMVFKAAPDGLRPGSLWFIDRRRVIWAGLVPTRRGLPSVDLTATVGPLRADWFSTEWDSRYYYSETPLIPCVRGAAVRMFNALRVPEIPKGCTLAAVVEEAPGMEGPWGSLPDLLQPETFQVFARLGLDPYAKTVGRHFGKTIPGIFTDEAKPHGGTPFTKDLFATFRKQAGYDLQPRLYQLFGEPLDDEAVRTRLDYRRWVMNRFLDGFVHPYRKWCDAHGLHLVGHFSPEDDPIQESVCLPAVMPIMKAMGFPGCDVIVPAVGDKASPTLNLGSLRVGSLKSQTGLRYGISETQALGEWTITSRKTRQIYAWQKVLGIDRFFTHGFYTSNDGVTNYEAPPDYGPNSSIFPGTGAVNAWLEACDAVLDGGHEVADVAVLDNVFAYWPFAPGMDAATLKQWRKAWWFTILHCLQAHVGIHALDAADAAEGTVTAAGLRVGKRTYKTILVPTAGLMAEPVFQRLREASAAGTRVIWFGGGPARLAKSSGPLFAAPAPAGEVLRTREPSPAWCRTNLPAQLAMRGAGCGDCFVRRFTAEDGRDCLFVANLAEADRVVTFDDENGDAWLPDPRLADGDTRRVKGGQRWRVPAMGSGLFTLGAASAAGGGTRRTVRAAGKAAAFERLSPNILRLDACRIVLKGRPAQQRPYPEPFWQRFADFRTTESIGIFSGTLPVESTVDESDLRYTFTFEARADVPGAVLVLDPRCARGRFRVFGNGRRLSGPLDFPLAGIAPLHLPVDIRRGVNAVEFRFEAQSAMEGLLANVRIAGDFAVTVQGGKPCVDAPAAVKVSPKGWLEMGLAHYMGDGVYRWSESFSERELAEGAWTLELDEVTDSARLEVNGVDQGTAAWAPWRWPLKGLKPGANTFTLTVSSTAGNALSLRYPAQPQGWIGGGRLMKG